MSIVTDARNYAGSALEQGKSGLSAASGRLLMLSGDTAGLAKGAFTLARKQAYATIGASDAIVASITKRTAELPNDARHTAITLLDTTKDRIAQANALATKAQVGVASAAAGLVQRSSDVVEATRGIDLTATARDGVGNRVGQVKDAFEQLADRGEQVAVDLRHDPVLTRAISTADRGVEVAANRVTSVAQRVRSRAAAQAEQESAATTSTPVRPTPAKRVPTHKTTVRKTAAGEAPISTIPTHRAAAIEAETRKQAALKAAETRKEAAEAREVAKEARRIAGIKAAETRKARADVVAAKRTATALKAAETRKANAAGVAARRKAQA